MIWAIQSNDIWKVWKSASVHASWAHSTGIYKPGKSNFFGLKHPLVAFVGMNGTPSPTLYQDFNCQIQAHGAHSHHFTFQPKTDMYHRYFGNGGRSNSHHDCHVVICNGSVSEDVQGIFNAYVIRWTFFQHISWIISKDWQNVNVSNSQMFIADNTFSQLKW